MMQLGNITYAPDYGCKDTAARFAVEGVGLGYGAPTYANDNVRHVAEATGRTGFVYLGSPYSKQTILDEAAYIAERAAARLMAKGMVVYSPIAHGHAIAGHGLPTGWDFWKAQCQPFIDAADSMIVLMMDGWEDSVGLTYEIEEFARQGKMVSYVEPDDLFARIDNPPEEYPAADREASAADRLYQARVEGVA